MPERSGLELPGLEAAALNLLCEDASGDYYDFIALPDGRRAVVIGDVSGHGLRSALVMAQARAFLRAYCDTLDDLDDVISRLDVALARDLSGGLFMSLVVLVIDPESGALTWCNAGHPAVLHLGAGGVEPLSPTSRILGVFPESGPRCGTPRTLASGDVLLLYTDGATEAFDDRREMFGEERLRDVLEENAGAAPAELVAAVHAALCAWKGVDHMDDDLTLVAVRRL
jgi:sigma-B regulation protein RsbU (phosphoserine phosphatase)